MNDHLRAGVAIFNAGHYHEAHDAWEDYWLALDDGTDDERFLHGLIQFTAVVHHVQNGNWEGAVGLAASGRAYLDGLPADYRGVNVETVRAFLDAVRADPECVERAGVPQLTHEGAALLPEELRFEPAAVVAVVFAEESERYDAAVVEKGIEYARADLDAGRATSRFVTFVMDFARDEANRGIVYRRLADHVGKREHEERDVEGLFD